MIEHIAQSGDRREGGAQPEGVFRDRPGIGIPELLTGGPTDNLGCVNSDGYFGRSICESGFD